jgi:hypothetical protein
MARTTASPKKQPTAMLRQGAEVRRSMTLRNRALRLAEKATKIAEEARKLADKALQGR